MSLRKKLLIAASLAAIATCSTTTGQAQTQTTTPSSTTTNTPEQSKTSEQKTKKSSIGEDTQEQINRTKSVRSKILIEKAKKNTSILACLNKGGSPEECLRETLRSGYVPLEVSMSDIDILIEKNQVSHAFVELPVSGYTVSIWALGPNGEFWHSLEPTVSFKPLLEDLRTKRIPTTMSMSRGILDNMPPLQELIGLGILLALLFSIARQVGSLKARSPAEKLDSDDIIPFSEIAGYDYIKKELKEVAEGLKNPDSDFAKYMPSGMLFTGPPGCGKTLMAAAMAKESGLPFYQVSGSDFTQIFVGMGALKLNMLFSKLRRKNSILFIDEIDALTRKRGINPTGGGSEQDNTLNKFLQLMDGADKKTKKNSNKRIFVIGATNNPEIIDPAVTRPDRLGRKVTFTLPDYNTREKTAEIYLKNTPHEENVLPSIIASWTPGMSGADIKDLIKQAALMAIREDRKLVSLMDLSNAVDLHLMGEPQDLTFSAEDKEIVKWHESAHALAIIILQGKSRIRRITVLPRGASLGSVATVPTEDIISTTLHDLLAQLISCLAGRSGEGMLYPNNPEKITIGASQDIVQATTTARHIVETFGFAELIGMTNHVDPIGQTILRSEHHTAISDSIIRNLITAAKTEADRILAENREAYYEIMKALDEQATITGEYAEEIVRKHNTGHHAQEYIERVMAVLKK